MSYGIFWLTHLGYSLLLVTTITAMASTAFKGANGRYPAKLEDLFPDFIDRISLDPFDGKPLKMKPVEGGVELYSVGRHPKSLSYAQKTQLIFIWAEKHMKNTGSNHRRNKDKKIVAIQVSLSLDRITG